MEKKVNRYRITLEQVSARTDGPIPTPIDLTFDNHDNVFSIIEYLQQKDPFNDQQEATQFAIGLKMFSEVMLKNKNNPLFEDLMPCFGAFMKKLKA